MRRSDLKPLLALVVAFESILSAAAWCGEAPAFTADFYPTRIGGVPSAISIADLNADGRPDVVSGDNSSLAIKVLFNLGSDRLAADYSYPTASRPTGVALGDLNGDGILDLVFTQEDLASVGVRLGLGGGAFGTSAVYPCAARPMEPRIVDLNGDGKQDVLVRSEFSPNLNVLPGDGLGALGAAILIQASSAVLDVAIEDFDMDGKLDIAMSTSGTTQLFELHRGIGGGAFALSLSVPRNFPGDAYRIATMDATQDGIPDIVAVLGTGALLSVYPGVGNGAFGTAIYSPGYNPNSFHPIAISAGDVNQDGIMDVLLCLPNDARHAVVMLGTGGGLFSYCQSCRAPVGANPAAQLLVDMDGDGYDDIVTSDQGPQSVNVTPGQGNGMFGRAAVIHTASFGFSSSLEAGDISGDGRPDILVTVEPGSEQNGVVASMINDGQGVFPDYHYDIGVGLVPRQFDVGRIDNDPVQDVAVANTYHSGNPSYEPTITLLKGSAGGYLQNIATLHVGDAPQCVAIGDFNGDQHADLAVASLGFPSIRIWFGDGQWGFQPGESFGPVGFAQDLKVADLNDDGNLDLVYTQGRGSCGGAGSGVYLGVGNGTFTPGPALPDLVCTPFELADVNEDGHIDIVLPYRALLGLGDGSFAPAATTPELFGSPYDIAVGDVDGDGHMDIAYSGFYEAAVVVLAGSGSGTFAYSNVFGVGPNPSGVAIADLDGDGKNELVALSWTENVVSIMRSVPTSVAPPSKLAAAHVGCGSQIRLTWTDESTGELGYEIQQRMDAAIFWQVVGQVPANLTEWTSPELTMGHTFQFRVRAFGESGCSLWATVPSLTTSPPFEIISATSDQQLYENGNATASISVVVQSSWGLSQDLHLTVGLTPSFGSGVIVGDEHFALAAGEEHVANFPWAVPGGKLAMEYTGNMNLTDEDTRTIACPASLTKNGWFSSNPIPPPVVQQYQSEASACWSHQTECGLRYVNYIPVAGTLASLALAANEFCKMSEFAERGDEGGVVGAFWAGHFKLTKLAITETTGYLLETFGFDPVLSTIRIIHTTGELARECWGDEAKRLLGWIPATVGPVNATAASRSLTGGETADSLLYWFDRGIDSTAADVADAFVAAGQCRLRILSDSSYCTKDSIGVSFAFVEQLDGVGVVGATGRNLHRIGRDPQDNPHSEAVFQLESFYYQEVSVAIRHSTDDGEKHELRYASISAWPGTIIQVSLTGESAESPLTVDLNGDGTVDQIYLPGGEVIGVSETGSGPHPTGFEIASANPFSDRVWIRYSAGNNQAAVLRIYDAVGRLVRDLSIVRGSGTGEHVLVWDGCDSSGRRLSSGVYFCRLASGEFQSTRRLVLLR